MLLAWGYHHSCVKGWLPNGLKLWASTVPVLGHGRASNLLYVQLVLSGHFSTRLNFFGILKLSSQFCFSVMYSQGEIFWLSFLPYWVVCSSTQVWASGLHHLARAAPWKYVIVFNSTESSVSFSLALTRDSSGCSCYFVLCWSKLCNLWKKPSEKRWGEYWS